ncbi:hypothetical protein CYMTET_55340 [Cymbomonas tetramitiformis]|uniref:Uncharacterized protein n=1 Tax=Cymbomonas tetramitiformis TaxID=36881 RepID=A0AAE0EMW8_9CHLO|nr:hypothetical protein CYMTET_55340 [Cymbomonas tetramitiformis]
MFMAMGTSKPKDWRGPEYPRTGGNQRTQGLAGTENPKTELGLADGVQEPGLTDAMQEPGLADVVQDPGLTDSVMAQDGLSG